MHSQLCPQMPGHPLTSNKNHTVDFSYRNKQKEPFICLMSIPLPSQTSDSIHMDKLNYAFYKYWASLMTQG